MKQTKCQFSAAQSADARLVLRSVCWSKTKTNGLVITRKCPLCPALPTPISPTRSHVNHSKTHKKEKQAEEKKRGGGPAARARALVYSLRPQTQMKYGIRAASGGGRSSARETIGRVAAGAIAEKWLRQQFGIEIVAWVSSVGPEQTTMSSEEVDALTREMVDDQLPVRCARKEDVERFTRVMEAAKADHDSIGGTVCCVCKHVPSGWGEPCFDKLPAMLAHGMMSIPATKGFEFGSGFEGTKMRGSQHNDAFVAKGTRLGTETNNSGGTQGGISNGENIVFKIAFKPPATIGQAQKTADFAGAETELAAKGRHDPCVVPRAVPIVEAMAALVLADAAMMQLARKATIATPLDIAGLNGATDEELRQRLEEHHHKLQAAETNAVQLAQATRRAKHEAHKMATTAVGAVVAATLVVGYSLFQKYIKQ
eukprot:m.39475 g.39475  ORF g.39475 m.39475 type:complete len:426 (-) comp11278_c0_seq1:194-1471(-)